MFSRIMASLLERPTDECQQQSSVCDKAVKRIDRQFSDRNGSSLRLPCA